MSVKKEVERAISKQDKFMTCIEGRIAQRTDDKDCQKLKQFYDCVEKPDHFNTGNKEFCFFPGGDCYYGCVNQIYGQKEVKVQKCAWDCFNRKKGYNCNKDCKDFDFYRY